MGGWRWEFRSALEEEVRGTWFFVLVRQVAGFLTWLGGAGGRADILEVQPPQAIDTTVVSQGPVTFSNWRTHDQTSSDHFVITYDMLTPCSLPQAPKTLPPKERGHRYLFEGEYHFVSTVMTALPFRHKL